jgi:NADH-quinone oxidoreductase subunit N
MLAYSSIAHAGYLMIGVAVGTPAAIAAVLYYLAVYAAMTTGAFAVAIALERGGQEADRIDDYAGLYQRAPLLAVATGLFMVSLAGLPPLGGFFAKLGVFAAAVEGGGAAGIALTLVGVLSSVVSVYYYLRVAYVMFTGEPSPEVRIIRSPLVDAALVLTAAAVVQIGIAPASVTAIAARVSALFR